MYKTLREQTQRVTTKNQVLTFMQIQNRKKNISNYNNDPYTENRSKADKIVIFQVSQNNQN